mmetsp:Transcript_124882/g.361250  ORF Transcript_124882/g.361250 Transcript_124882/m.361250 type:complete len:216 (-) Transcript_124882:17-664(-)
MLKQGIDHLWAPLARGEENRRLAVAVAMVEVALPPGVVPQALDVACFCEVVRGGLLVKIDVVQVDAIFLDEEFRHLGSVPRVLHGVERQCLAQVVHRLRIEGVIPEGLTQRLRALLADSPPSLVPPTQQRDGRAVDVADVHDVPGPQLLRLVDQLLLLDGDAEAAVDRHLQLLQTPTACPIERALLAANADDAQRHGDHSKAKNKVVRARLRQSV